jgi:hypothetical protein
MRNRQADLAANGIGIIRSASPSVDNEKREWYRRANLRGSPQKIDDNTITIEICIHC